ncbi:MAG: tripartite tricarboxylate transporter TctB family protein, partial [Rhodothermales bacterium]|nr:tripartite tricarboxylate transporter TctB family protein [Rhodothermales bacterium]
PNPEPRNILPDCIIPALAACFAIYYLTTITEVPWISQASAVIVSALLLLSIIAFIIRSVSRIRRGQETLRFSTTGENLLGDPVTIARRIVLLALTITYVWIIDSWGFTVTTFCFIFLGILLLSSLSNWKKAFLVSFSCSFIGYIVFIYFFKTRFPAGPLEIWLKTNLL